MCSILPTNSFISIPLPVSYSLSNNHCHPISPLCETYNHLGLLSAYKFSLHNQGLRVKYHTNAPARHRTRVCSRQVQESEWRDIPAKTGESAQFVRLEELLGKDSQINSSARDFLVVTFYKFVRIEDPEGEVAKHRSFLQGRDIHGRIYMSQQGINAQRIISDPLAGVDKASTDIMMYCTGGIRCDVYSVILRQKGFQNLYTLKGGIAQYLKEEGHFKWMGNLFVFDSRLSVSPNVFKPINATNKQRRVLSHGEIQGDQDFLAFGNSTFGRCHLCGSMLSEMRHRNCANLDCNRLILSCQECVQEFKGCCSTICKNAPRLRPVLYDAQPYERWHKYRDSICSTQNVRKNNP